MRKTFGFVSCSWSHLGDSNPGPTVYESGCSRKDLAEIGRLAGLALGFLELIHAESPFALTRAIELAGAVLEVQRAVVGASKTQGQRTEPAITMRTK